MVTLDGAPLAGVAALAAPGDRAPASGGVALTITLPAETSLGSHRLVVRWADGQAQALTLDAAATITRGTNLGEPDDVTVAPDGSLLYSNLKANSVDQLLPDGSVQRLVSGLNIPEGLAVTGPDRLVLAEQGTNRVLSWQAGGALRRLLQLPTRAGVDGIDGLDVTTSDGQRTGLIPDSANGRLYLLNLATLATTAVPGRWQRPTDATVYAGRLYLVDEYGGRLWRGPLAGPLQPLGPALRLPDDVVVTADGTVYINELASGANGSIMRVDPNGSGERILTGLSDPQGLALDAAENLVLTESGRGRIATMVRSCAPLLLGPADLRLHAGGPSLVMPIGSDCAPGMAAPTLALALGARWPAASLSPSWSAAAGATTVDLPNGVRASVRPGAGSALLYLQPPAQAASAADATLAVLVQTGGRSIPLQLRLTVG